MKIHTTQDLTSIRDISINNSVPREVRYDYLEQKRLQNLCKQPDSYERNVSFKGKKEVVTKTTRAVGKEKNKVAKWFNHMTNKILSHGSFDRLLDNMNHEVFIQAGISLLICVVARPITIMAMAICDKSGDKKDYEYAAGHSVSSGFAGFIASLIIATPFSKGAKRLAKNYMHELSPETIKRVFPHVDMDSIWQDASKTVKKPMSEWKDINGNPFEKDVKNVKKVAKPKFISEVSEETLKTFGADVDLKAMNNKSVNDWTDRNGKKLHFDLKEMFIQVRNPDVTEKGKPSEAFFSLKHIDENFLKEVYPDLDIASITKDGNRVHTDFWKNTDGTPFKLDMDTVQISSYRETVEAKPLHTGKTRVENAGTKKAETKYLSYQDNIESEKQTNVPDKLGSEIKQEWLYADKRNENTQKLLTWLPDIVTRPLVAAGTIEILPIVLKGVFGLEKRKKTPETEQKAVEVKLEPGKGEQEKDVQAPRKEVA